MPLDRAGVAADRGIVTLTGSVDYNFQREAVEHDAIRLAGVREVANLIAVSSFEMLASDAADRIALAFERNAELADDEVSVTIEGATVTLGGTVRTWSEYGEAEAAAWRAPGVGEVVNNLLVTD
ncbi:MAG: hypothetical protein JWO42_4072 [Chloroflexi bacterium]|nr:hypothetical protein [Chloroflexota bacterium]